MHNAQKLIENNGSSKEGKIIASDEEPNEEFVDIQKTYMNGRLYTGLKMNYQGNSIGIASAVGSSIGNRINQAEQYSKAQSSTASRNFPAGGGKNVDRHSKAQSSAAGDNEIG